MKPKPPFCLLLLTWLLLAGCTAENLVDCPAEMVFKMNYTFNRYDQDKFAEQVKSMELFLYDESMQLLQRRTLTSSEMAEQELSFRLVPGKYTVVAWGNWQPAHYRFSGENTLEGMRLSLVHTNKWVLNRPEALFHNSTHFVVHPQTPIQQTLSFKKNTNTIRVVLEGAMADSPPTRASSSGTPYAITIVGSNGVFAYNNTVASSPQLSYTPQYIRSIPGFNNALGADFTVLRLFKGDDVRVVITNGTEVMVNRPLVEMLMLSDEINTNDDLDRYDEYTLRFDANFMLAGIKVVDWTYISHSDGGI